MLSFWVCVDCLCWCMTHSSSSNISSSLHKELYRPFALRGTCRDISYRRRQPSFTVTFTLSRGEEEEEEECKRRKHSHLPCLVRSFDEHRGKTSLDPRSHQNYHRVNPTLREGAEDENKWSCTALVLYWHSIWFGQASINHNAKGCLLFSDLEQQQHNCSLCMLYR